jgi:hypothetical protein
VKNRFHILPFKFNLQRYSVDVTEACARMFLQKSLGAVSMCQDPRVSDAMSGNNPETLFGDAIVVGLCTLESS